MITYLRRYGLFYCLGGWTILFGLTSVTMASSTEDLIGALKSPDATTRLSAIDQLGAQGAKSAEAVVPLTALLKDDSAVVRARAAIALGEIGQPAKGASSELVSLLKDDDPSVRRQAVRALGAIRPGPKIMIPLFVKLMEDLDPGVRVRVLGAVAEAGEAAVPGLIEALKNDKAAYWACVVLRDIGPAAKAAVPALAEKLTDPRPDIRREAVLALGAMNQAAAAVIPQIVATLGDENTRNAATFVLGQLGMIPADAEPTIRANAKSDDKFLSTVSLWALARVHPEDKDLRRQATELIVERLKDNDPFVRVAAARALAALPPAPAITLPIWRKAMKDANSATINQALDALAELGAPAVPTLVNVLENHEDLSVYVVYTLGQMGPAAASATAALARLVADQDANLASEAAIALSKIGPAASGAVPALCAALDRPDCPDAHEIILALGNIGPAAVVAEPLVVKAMSSKDGALAVIAASALTQIHPQSDSAAAKAIPVLVAGLSDSLPEIRRAAADALGALGPLGREAVPALQLASKDSAKSVREAAEKAIQAISGPAAMPQ
jgi:HEAT repeat protein